MGAVGASEKGEGVVRKVSNAPLNPSPLPRFIFDIRSQFCSLRVVLWKHLLRRLAAI